MNRDLYFKSIFCDGRIFPRNDEVIRMPLAQLLERFEEQSFPAPKVNYIFHMAHGGSTLLSRAIDFRGTNIVYREPAALRQLGVSAAQEQFGDNPPDIWKRVFDLSTTLLAKSYQNNQRVIIKANVPVNFMIPHLMKVNPNTRAIILYAGLEDYLLSILKTDGHRTWMRNVVGEVGNTIDTVLGLAKGAREGLSDAEAAASLWMVQIHLFAKALTQFPNIKSLDSEIFYRLPKLTLDKLCQFYRIKAKDKKLDAIVNSELFTRYSKAPEQHYDNAMRLEKKKELRTQISDEVQSANEWVRSRTEHCELPASLTKPLTAQLSKLLSC